MTPLSRRYASYTENSAKRAKRFPYDVPYLPARAVWQLVEQAKPLYLSDRVFVQLARDAERGDIPSSLLDALAPLRGRKHRFTTEEFRRELVSLLGVADFSRHEDRLTRYCQECATIAAVWTTERAEAHLQEDDVLKRRASASDRLWSVWQEASHRGKRLTESQVRQWVRIEQLEQMMVPPMWVHHHARLKRIPAVRLWAEELERRGTSLDAVRAAHVAALRQC